MVCILQAALQGSESTTLPPERWTDGTGMPDVRGNRTPVAVDDHELDDSSRSSQVHVHHEDNAHSCCGPDHLLEGADVSKVCHQSAVSRLALINSLSAYG